MKTNFYPRNRKCALHIALLLTGMLIGSITCIARLNTLADALIKTSTFKKFAETAIVGGTISYPSGFFGRGCTNAKIKFGSTAPASGGSGKFYYTWQDSIPGVTTGWRNASSASPIATTFEGTILYDKVRYYRRMAEDQDDATERAYSNKLSIQIYSADHGSIKFSEIDNYTVTLTPSTQPPMMVNTSDGWVEFPPMYYAWEKKKSINGYWNDIPGSFEKKSIQPPTENVQDTFYYRRYVLDGCQPQPGGSNILTIIYQNLMPVTWIKTNAVNQKGNILINWQVANEIANTGFFVFRSYNGSDFEKISFVPANENQSTGIYTFTDNSPMPTGENILYKIQQVDKDGKTTFSPVKTVKFVSRFPFKIFPNPITNQIRLTGVGEVNGIAIIELIDNNGRKLLQQKMAFNGKANIPVAHIASGSYILKVSINNRQFTQQVVIGQ